MSHSPADTLTITREDGKGFELFTSFTVMNSVVRCSEASFETGDLASFETMSEFVAIGRKFTVAINGRERCTGRVQLLETPVSAEQSVVNRFVVRTRLADVEWASADTKIRVKNASIKSIIEAVLKPQGILASDIVYRADVARDVITGKKTRGGAPPKDLEPLQEKAAAVQPGETVKAFLDRHLRRHGLMIWDSPDGKVVISEPDDDQDPIYFFRCLKGNDGQFNNFLDSGLTFDVTGVPTAVVAFGHAGGGDFRRTKSSAQLVNEELVALGFYRPTLIVDEGLKTKQLAQRAVAREYSERIRRQNFMPIVCDGFGFPDSDYDRIPYAPDTCAEIINEATGGSIGKYYIEETVLRRTVDQADRSMLGCVKAGTWTL